MNSLTHLISRVIERTETETEQRFEKWGLQNHTPETWLVILMEELGEAAQARLMNGKAEFREELYDIATAAICALVELDAKELSSTITINGKQHTVTTATIAFEDICRLAGQPEYSTVMYTRGYNSKPTGTLLKGKWILVKDGMEFDAVPT